ncbi:sodium/glucose cotransporter 4-like [Mercenaria mercenaria]|uniref:sodium/glucose cotransporter 4-like n=1 Tax=Mercenaria mercenaria TaxID=6596 RepID=UPI00234F177D|nr:sodium/glucose cotransporter 4-like [Mercenaria mercenaria]
MTNATGAFEQRSGIGTVDLVIIIIYFLLCLGVGIWATIRTQRSSISGYFLAGRDMLWFGIGASLFASDIGSGAIVGFAGTGAYSGIAVASYELNGLYCVLALGWFFVPVYIASGVFTMPEYLKKRFGGQRLQVYMALLSLLLYVFTKISVDIYAGAIFIQQTVGWNMYLGITGILCLTALFTISGGLRAVIYTDTLQTVIMVGGAIVLMIISFVKIGGLKNLYRDFPKAIPQPLVNHSDCGKPTAEAFHLLRDPVTGDLPWPGNVFGITILGMWYFCSDQVLVQRSLAAKNMLHVKGGSILAGYIKLTPLFTIVFPGMISRVLFPDEIACVDADVCNVVCGNPAGCTNIAYPKLVVELMPTGLKGLMLAAMIAALMSSLTSVFNSSSTIFTLDIWHRIRKQASDRELLIVGRLFVLLLAIISVVWIPVLQLSQGGLLFNYIQSVTGYLAPPVLSIYVLAIVWTRTNEQGAFWGLVVGFAVGLIRMGLDFGYGSLGCGEEDSRPLVISKIHFLHFTIILFLISLIVTILISLCTSPIEDKHLIRLTWWTRHSSENREPFEEELTEITNRTVAKAESTTEPEQVSNPSLTTWTTLHLRHFGFESREFKIFQQTDIYHLMSIEEDQKWSKFVNFNAVLLMLIAMFLWGYYH